MVASHGFFKKAASKINWWSLQQDELKKLADRHDFYFVDINIEIEAIEKIINFFMQRMVLSLREMKPLEPDHKLNSHFVAEIKSLYIRLESKLELPLEMLKHAIANYHANVVDIQKQTIFNKLNERVTFFLAELKKEELTAKQCQTLCFAFVKMLKTLELHILEKFLTPKIDEMAKAAVCCKFCVIL